MLSYEQIVRSLMRSEAGYHVSEGTTLSFAVPGRDENGTLIDSFFLYTRDLSGAPTEPVARLGVCAETGAAAFYQDLLEPLFPDSLDLDTLDIAFETHEPPVLTLHRPSPQTRRDAKTLSQRYKQLYPQIRSFAFAEKLDKKKRKLLQEYFHLQWVLFEDQLSDYRQTAPEFYSWMIGKLSSSVSFLELCKSIQARISQVRNYLAMAAGEAEQQILLGMNNAEFAVWKAYGDNMLRTILAGRVLKEDFTQFTNYADPALIAARSYNPASPGKIKLHSERLEQVRQIARNLRAEYALALPVDPQTLADRLGIQVCHTELDTDIDGYVTMDHAGDVITINTKKRYAPRQRFTLAHEIGHVVIPWHTGTIQCNTDNPSASLSDRKKVDFQEEEANVFASELLIPSDWLKKRMKRAKNFERLLTNVTDGTKASVMACLYAIEPLLPSGEVVYVTSDAMQYWKAFRTPDTYTWKMGCKDPFRMLEAACTNPEVFKFRGYEIRRYRLCPCPDLTQVSQRYESCGCDLGRLLDEITGQQPQQALHCLNRILNALPDRIYAFLEPYEGNRPVYCRHKNTEMKIPREVDSYDCLITWLEENRLDYRQISLPDGKRLTWIKET